MLSKLRPDQNSRFWIHCGPAVPSIPTRRLRRRFRKILGQRHGFEHLSRRSRRVKADGFALVHRYLKCNLGFRFVYPTAGRTSGCDARSSASVFIAVVKRGGADGYKQLTLRGLETLVVAALRELRVEQGNRVAELEAWSRKPERLMNQIIAAAK